MKSFKEFINEDTLEEAVYTSSHAGSVESVAKLHANAQALDGHKVIHSVTKPNGDRTLVTQKGKQFRVHQITAGKKPGTAGILNRPATPEEIEKHSKS